ncbi:MAG TPA: STAS domain-containing protein [Bryobacteraceae bacterium]|nr:STAS domain-containing protein [Bryobacteraceae bacterium]HOL70175.1 STAS domain-containing protein [Bryobacteraceae bacterium]HOQ45483.1 STAS domain-containing protein [Bryobacteraceae bacterium]HPQ16206.1 STAS domain-containing protein [Bryobacteraceae bacterium]HPU74175.1 STAS domain-containing protein [Bryobacteraceae bacterium]
MKTVGLQVSHKEAPSGVVVIELAGKMMLGDANAVEDLITRLLQEGRRKFVVDLSGVTHIDSTGIGKCIASLGKVGQAGGALVMAGATGMVREGFRVTRLDTVFRFYPDVESAVAAI